MIHFSIKLAALAAVASLGVACVVASPTPAPGTESGKAEGELTVSRADGKLSGVYTLNADKATFEVSALDNKSTVITIKARGLTLDSTIGDGVASFDGFATDNGEDTQIAKEDRTLLIALDKALIAELGKAAKDGDKAADLLTRSTEIWGEWPTTLKLSRRILSEENRSYSSWCGLIGTSQNVSHDCGIWPWSHSWWASETSQHAYIGDYGTSTTYYYHSNGWTTATYDHANWPWEYNECFGRCGASCNGFPGAPGGPHIYSADCANHDGCVRNGHWTVSLYCDDQFADTVDDSVSSPNCY